MSDTLDYCEAENTWNWFSKYDQTCIHDWFRMRYKGKGDTHMITSNTESSSTKHSTGVILSLRPNMRKWWCHSFLGDEEQGLAAGTPYNRGPFGDQSCILRVGCSPSQERT